MIRLLALLEEALASKDPELLQRTRPGLESAALAAAEGRLGRPLPPALRELWSWRDGHDGKGTFPAAGVRVRQGVLLPLDAAVAAREKPAVGDRWPPAWLPLVDAGDGDLLAADLASEGPAIVELRHEEAEWPVVHDDARAWIRAVVADLEDRPSPPGALPVWRTLGEDLPEDPEEAAAALRSRVAEGRLVPERLEAARLLGDERAARALDRPSAPLPASWADLRSRIEALGGLDRPDLLVRMALAVPEAAAPPGQAHPLMTALREGVASWCRRPTPSARREVEKVLAERSRSFVPQARVDLGAQEGARAVLATSARAAIPTVLPALAAGLGPDPTTADAESVRDRLRLLRDAVVPWALGIADPLDEPRGPGVR